MDDWKRELSDLFEKRETDERETARKIEEKQPDVPAFYLTKVIPAFNEIKAELEKYGREVQVHGYEHGASITVSHQGQEQMRYSIEVRVGPGRAFPYPKLRLKDRNTGATFGSEGSLRSGGQDYDVTDISKGEIVRNVLDTYKPYIEDGGVVYGSPASDSMGTRSP